MKKKLPAICILLVFLIGLSLLLYPTVSDWWNSLHQTQAIADYTKQVADMNDDAYEEIWNDAIEYNERLTEKGNNRFQLTEEDKTGYTGQLNISGTGIMGYIEIPAVNITLPIYHGTSDAVLSAGVGHIEESSLPVGGKSTHCCLSGHRGLPSAKLFSDLDKMVIGDTFILRILDETLTYEVDQIRIVEPQEVGQITIEAGKDYCTLVTCTPYGINTHRLLVRGRRVENAAQALNVRVTADALLIEPAVVAPFAAVPILLALLLVLLFKTRKRNPKS